MLPLDILLVGILFLSGLHSWCRLLICVLLCCILWCILFGGSPKVIIPSGLPPLIPTRFPLMSRGRCCDDGTDVPIVWSSSHQPPRGPALPFGHSDGSLLPGLTGLGHPGALQSAFACSL